MGPTKLTPNPRPLNTQGKNDDITMSYMVAFQRAKFGMQQTRENLNIQKHLQL